MDFFRPAQRIKVDLILRIINNQFAIKNSEKLVKLIHMPALFFMDKDSGEMLQFLLMEAIIGARDTAKGIHLTVERLNNIAALENLLGIRKIRQPSPLLPIDKIEPFNNEILNFELVEQ